MCLSKINLFKLLIVSFIFVDRLKSLSMHILKYEDFKCDMSTVTFAVQLI